MQELRYSRPGQNWYWYNIIGFLLDILIFIDLLSKISIKIVIPPILILEITSLFKISTLNAIWVYSNCNDAGSISRFSRSIKNVKI